MAYWLGRGIQDRNENFEREFEPRWWILFRKFEILSKSCTITAAIIYRCYPVTPSRQQPKYALGASSPLAMGTNYTQDKWIQSTYLNIDLLHFRYCTRECPTLDYALVPAGLYGRPTPVFLKKHKYLKQLMDMSNDFVALLLAYRLKRLRAFPLLFILLRISSFPITLLPAPSP